MATRRMINRDFIFSDTFTALPATAQVLYVRLLLCADDEGFLLNAKLHQRILGSRTKPLKVLEDASLIHTFDSGVTLLLHWNIHNKVSSKTFIPTMFQAEKALVILDKSKIYRLKNASEFPKKEQEISPQYSIEKDNKEKESIEKESSAAASVPEAPCSDKKSDFDLFWESYPNKIGKSFAKKEFQKVDAPVDVILAGLENHKKSRQWKADGGIYIPKAENWLAGKRWQTPLPPDAATTWGSTDRLGPEELNAIKRAMADGI